ncbi:MAG: hypothetical protein E7461_05725 [Ruminococcaceae bacterium]|nr:hypothetical protein [Oscillospiraceae bacterium]
MKTKRSIILIIVVLILIPVVLTGCKGFWPLSAKRKAEIEDAHKMLYGRDIAWWDENGYDRIPTVFRYFDTYGDCIVLLRYIPTPSDWLGNPIDPPYMLDYLTRPVECPTAVSPTGHKVIFSIWLYNTDPSWRKVFNDADDPHNLDAPLTTMEDLHNRGLTWLTNEELEQLTTDLENWLAVGNY